MALAAVLLLSFAASSWACGKAGTLPGQIEIVTAEVTLRATPRPAGLVSGRHFTLEVELCKGALSAPGMVLARVDADMPEHRHGMNYRPSVHRLASGRYRVEGLLFHMPGLWRLRFDIVDAGHPLELTHLSTVQ
ncbi:MAG: hypothetical protein E6R11_02260 [Rhodocyclaceae bacterium]|jgi:hypothetical protein|nr:MAG: hypothetical protein E6R11_02260 [Rhodocyclaceae bacterium]